MTKTIWGYLSVVVALAAAGGLGGCAVHPLPENVQPKNTPAIVKHIRCEARQAIEQNAIELLGSPNLPRENQEAARILAARLVADETLFRRLTVADLPGKVAKEFYLKYINSGIAYNYDFDITEENNNNTELDFGRMLTHDTVSLKLTAKANLSREADRQFIVSDTFESLIDSDVCKGEEPSIPSLLYPVSGEIGLHETISSFIHLNEEDVLKLRSDGSGDEVLYSDRLKFTSVYGGSVNPGVTLNPGSTYRLTQATLNAEAVRTDANQVIIGLSLGKKGDTRSTRSVKRAAGQSGVFGAALLRPNAPEGAEERAISATVQNRVNSFLNNFGTLRLQ